MKNSLEKIIKKLGESLSGEISIPIIVGGWAINYLGYTRNTLDFDFMILEDDFLLVEKELLKLGYEKAVKTSLYARFYIKDNEKMPYIDCLFANKQTYDRIVESGEQIDIFGAAYILPKITHIIAMKLHAVKYGEEHRMGKDFEDIVALIEIHDLDVSHNSEIYLLCKRYADEDIYRRIKNAITGK